MVNHRLFLPLALALLAPACGPKQAAPPTTPPAAEPAPEPVDPIPEGFFTLTPHLVVADVDAAVDFYGKAFGAQKQYSMPGPDGVTMHAEIKIGDSIVMVAREDEGMKSPATLGGSPATLLMYVDDADATYQAALDAGARAWTPVEEMFWGDRYGELEDPSGHRWALATHVEDLTPEQLQERAAIAMPPPETGKKGKKAKKAKKPSGPPKWKEIVGTPATDPTPEPYHTVTISLTTSDANAAIAYYKAAFDAQDRSLMPGPDGAKVMHAELTIGDSILMLSDEFPEMGGKSASTLGGSPVMVHMYSTDADAAFAKATGAGGTAAVPMTNMFWGDRYGMLVDVAGFTWAVATHVENVPPEQMGERMKAQLGAQPAAGEGGEATPAEAGEEAGDEEG